MAVEEVSGESLLERIDDSLNLVEKGALIAGSVYVLLEIVKPAVDALISAL